MEGGNSNMHTSESLRPKFGPVPIRNRANKTIIEQREIIAGAFLEGIMPLSTCANLINEEDGFPMIKFTGWVPTERAKECSDRCGVPSWPAGAGHLLEKAIRAHLHLARG